MQQLKLIVVDDSRTARAIMRKGFETAGYIVHDTDSVKPALELILNERPDALLLDLTMPDLPIDEFIKQVNELRHTRGLAMKLLLYSAHSREQLLKFAAECGADGCIEKSQGIARCVAEVNAHLKDQLLG